MSLNTYQQELNEQEEIEREDALQRIAMLVKRFDLKRHELEKVFSGTGQSEASAHDHYLVTVKPEARRFDPFFDAW